MVFVSCACFFLAREEVDAKGWPEQEGDKTMTVSSWHFLGGRDTVVVLTPKRTRRGDSVCEFCCWGSWKADKDKKERWQLLLWVVFFPGNRETLCVCELCFFSEEVEEPMRTRRRGDDNFYGKRQKWCTEEDIKKRRCFLIFLGGKGQTRYTNDNKKKRQLLLHLVFVWKRQAKKTCFLSVIMLSLKRTKRPTLVPVEKPRESQLRAGTDCPSWSSPGGKSDGRSWTEV